MLKKARLHFNKLPEILMVQIGRMGKEGSLVDETPVELRTAPLDLGPFTSSPEE